MKDVEPMAALREHLSSLTSLFVLGMVMSDRHDEQEILRLAVSSVASLTSCRPLVTALAGDDMRLHAPNGRTVVRPDLTARLVELDGREGSVDGTDAAWMWAYPLRALGGQAGYLVVGADAEPSENRRFLLRMLAQQAGSALSGAALYSRERETAQRLRTANSELEGVNRELLTSVAAMEGRRKAHEALASVAASGAGEPGIADALFRLTGLGVAVEDRFGNLQAWAGPGRPERYPPIPAPRRTQLLAEARRSPLPIRDRDRLIAVAQPREEVLGVIVLVDPDRRAGEHETFALAHGAVVLAMELVHRRSLAETELRLRRQLVDDLLTGTDDESAVLRADPLGHDLRGPHHVLVVQWTGDHPDEALIRAVDRAADTVLDARVLQARRGGRVVVVVRRPEAWAEGHRWNEMFRALGRRMRSGTGSMGVGGVCRTPSGLPRSFAEAERALRIRLETADPTGVVVYDDLGIYRLLALGDDDQEVRRFVREWLGPLLDYDSANHSNLVLTLWQYLECGGNYDAAARALLIHRSTLRYRLRRIRELGDHDLSEVDTRLNMHVATRAWNVLRGSI
ncbi:MAG TPA: helix-turn-helix domain-containing protein [Pseudonocardia sp.]|jgi:sugar diacid utilization regulator|nr:helix-turn-helix domain-containing protein [Pseudonocardia sp.]